MSYFALIDDYKTYADSDDDFHFDYNSTSGGGQAFLAGSFKDGSGALESSQILKGYKIHFEIARHASNGTALQIDLGGEDAAIYEVTTRAKDNPNVKLELKDKKKKQPSVFMSPLFMLPPTAAINEPDSLGVNPLTSKNYWLRSMWLNCDIDKNRKEAVFIPRDFVFSGGFYKKGSREDAVQYGEPTYYKLRYEQRINDVLRLYDAITSSSLISEPYIVECVGYFAGVYSGSEQYKRETAGKFIENMMKVLSLAYPEYYSGYDDPLPALMRIAGLVCSDCPPNRMTDTRKLPHNLVYYGAPGTGKSHEVNKRAHEVFNKNIRRVTFYPDYTYSQFVGCYKPDTDDNGDITYDYTPGPFLETYLEACVNPDKIYVLVIEEINRANPAAVFGDVFQLLDRQGSVKSKYCDGRSGYASDRSTCGSGWSTYGVAVPKDMKKYIEKYLDDEKFAALKAMNPPSEDLCDMPPDDYWASLKEELVLPPNMYIWATMNNADQGVVPMDTAYKRRWDFKYIGVDEKESVIADKTVAVGDNEVYWNKLRRAINDLLIDKADVEEDKLLGPFFISPSTLDDKDKFARAFKDKVLMYLFDDACKMKRTEIFGSGPESKRFSKLCDAFDKNGVEVFEFGDDFDVSSLYVPVAEVDSAEPSDAGEAPDGDAGAPVADATGGDGAEDSEE